MLEGIGSTEKKHKRKLSTTAFQLRHWKFSFAPLKALGSARQRSRLPLVPLLALANRRGDLHIR